LVFTALYIVVTRIIWVGLITAYQPLRLAP